MAKKKAASRTTPSPTKAVVAGEQADSQLSVLKHDGNKLFGQKEYQKALEAYDKALKMGPQSSDKALLHNNKAACCMMLKRHKEAINECSAALEVNPAYLKALVRRAKAYELMGHYKQALSDTQKALKLDDGNADIAETERRLKDTLSGKRPLSANGLARRASPAAKALRQGTQLFMAKVTLDDEVRVLHMSPSATYAELLATVRDKFPAAGPVVLKYLDRDGDLVTITDKAVLQTALANAWAEAERAIASAGGRASREMVPPIRIQLQRVASEADVPKPPVEEAVAAEQVRLARRQYELQQQAQLARQKKAVDEAEAAAAEPAPAYQLEQWLLDFAGVFRDMTGIEIDKHLELEQLAWDKYHEAMEETLSSDKALPLLEKAADRFVESASACLTQSGNAYMAAARKHQDDVNKGRLTLQEARPQCEALFKRADERYRQALGHKADFWDARVSLAQLAAERAKLAAGYLPVNVKQEAAADDKDPAQVEAASAKQQERITAATHAMLAGLKAEDVKAAEPFWAESDREYEAAAAALPKEDRERPMKPPTAQQAPPAEGEAPEEPHLYAHTLLNWGNTLYEASQVRAAGGQAAWRATLDSAVAKFRACKCDEKDIRVALKAHCRAGELDLGPDPEPAKPAEAEAAKAEAKGEAKAEAKAEAKGKEVEAPVKGLPQLSKPKKKAEASA